MQVKRKYILGLIITLTLFISGPPYVSAGEGLKITIETLNDKLENPDVVVIDVRDIKDWEISPLKIKGAVREDPTKVKTWASKFSKENTLVTYCA